MIKRNSESFKEELLSLSRDINIKLNFICANVQADLNRLYIHVSRTHIHDTAQCFLGVKPFKHHSSSTTLPAAALISQETVPSMWTDKSYK